MHLVALLGKDLVDQEDHLVKLQEVQGEKDLVDQEDHQAKVLEVLEVKDQVGQEDLMDKDLEDQTKMDKKNLSHKVLWMNVHVLMNL